MNPIHVIIDGPAGTPSLSGESCAPEGYMTPDQAKTIVIMAHDIPFSHSRGHHDLFGYLRGVFATHGYTTLMFDYQSCGDSSGREEELTLSAARENLSRVIAWAKEKKYEKFILVGCGVSAALCLEAADENTRMVFLFWPMIDLAGLAKRTLYEDGKISASKGRRIGGDLVAQMEAYDPASIAKSLKVPALIQYGARDTVVGTAHIDLIKRHFHALRLDITGYEDGNHGLTDPRHRKMMDHHMRSFLQKYA